MKTHLDDVRDQWWSLTDEHRAELREEFRKRMATDDAFSRTTAILLELHDKNAALEGRLRALEDALRGVRERGHTASPCYCPDWKWEDREDDPDLYQHHPPCEAARAALAAAETEKP